MRHAVVYFAFSPNVQAESLAPPSDDYHGNWDIYGTSALGSLWYTYCSLCNSQYDGNSEIRQKLVDRSDVKSRSGCTLLWSVLHSKCKSTTAVNNSRSVATRRHDGSPAHCRLHGISKRNLTSWPVSLWPNRNFWLLITDNGAHAMRQPDSGLLSTLRRLCNYFRFMVAILEKGGWRWICISRPLGNSNPPKNYEADVYDAVGAQMNGHIGDRIAEMAIHLAVYSAPFWTEALDRRPKSRIY